MIPISSYAPAGAMIGGALGAAGGTLLGTLGRALAPLDYPRQAALNMVRQPLRYLSGQGSANDLLGALPGLAGAGLAGGLIASGVGAPIGLGLGALVAGAGQGVGHLFDQGQEDRPFDAPTPGDLATQAGFNERANPWGHALGSFAIGAATDPLSYVGMLGGGHAGAQAGRAAGEGLAEAAAARGPMYEGGIEKLLGLDLSGASPEVRQAAGWHIGDMRKSQDLNRILSEIPPGSQYLGAGAEALALRTPQGGVLKIIPKIGAPSVPNVPEVLQPTRFAPLQDYNVIHSPMAENVGNHAYANAHANELATALRGRGYDAYDLGANNIGSYGGKPVVIDYGSVDRLGEALPKIPGSQQPGMFKSALLRMLGSGNEIRAGLAPPVLEGTADRLAAQAANPINAANPTRVPTTMAQQALGAPRPFELPPGPAAGWAMPGGYMGNTDAMEAFVAANEREAAEQAAEQAARQSAPFMQGRTGPYAPYDPEQAVANLGRHRAMQEALHQPYTAPMEQMGPPRPLTLEELEREAQFAHGIRRDYVIQHGLGDPATAAAHGEYGQPWSKIDQTFKQNILDSEEAYQQAVMARERQMLQIPPEQHLPFDPGQSRPLSEMEQNLLFEMQDANDVKDLLSLQLPNKFNQEVQRELRTLENALSLYPVREASSSIPQLDAIRDLVRGQALPENLFATLEAGDQLGLPLEKGRLVKKYLSDLRDIHTYDQFGEYAPEIAPSNEEVGSLLAELQQSGHDIDAEELLRHYHNTNPELPPEEWMHEPRWATRSPGGGGLGVPVTERQMDHALLYNLGEGASDADWANLMRQHMPPVEGQGAAQFGPGTLEPHIMQSLTSAGAPADLIDRLARMTHYPDFPLGMLGEWQDIMKGFAPHGISPRELRAIIQRGLPPPG